MIRPYLRDLIDEHNPTEELNNNNSNNNNNNNNNKKRAEWKIQLHMHIKCSSTKSFENRCTMHPKSEPVEIFVGSDTNDVIDKLFNTLLQKDSKITRNIK